MVSEQNKVLVRYQAFWHVFLCCTFVSQPLWNSQVWIIQSMYNRLSPVLSVYSSYCILANTVHI